MKTNSIPPVGMTRTVFATAIALMLAGPAYAAEPKGTTSQYDSAVTYDAHHTQQSTYKLRASKLIGRDLHNAKDNEIGEIDDLIVSRDGDKIMAIVSLGGFFNIGSKLVAIPYEDLRVTEDGKHIYYNATEEELKARAEFTYADGERSANAGNPADNNAPNPRENADRASTMAASPADKSADNSAHNKRERSGDTLTPLDQSHAKADVDITRAIRKALGDDDTLSTNAKNVKVITVDGRVTLRGAVADAEQQERVVAIARQAAGPDHVQSELEVIKR